jgi:hypothetical protein
MVCLTINLRTDRIPKEIVLLLQFMAFNVVTSLHSLQFVFESANLVSEITDGHVVVVAEQTIL